MERCYYHKFPDRNGKAGIYQPKLGKGLEITFDAEELDGFVEWKMMGVRDYVLGLECGNCYPDGRDVMRKTGMLKFLEPGEKKCVSFSLREEDVSFTGMDGKFGFEPGEFEILMGPDSSRGLTDRFIWEKEVEETYER